MTRNQKIALGCGGAGCLGLIVIVFAAGLFYFFAYNQRARYERASRDYNFNVNLNSNSDNTNFDEPANDNSLNSNSTSSSSSPASSMSNDDKHKLYHAATVTGNAGLMQRVMTKLGLMDDDGIPLDGYQEFLTQHAAWVFRNLDFVREVSTKDKAQAYVDQHLE